MNKHALVSRFTTAVVFSLVVAIICATLLLLTLSKDAFKELRTADLIPRAQSFAVFAEDYLKGEVSEELMWKLTRPEDVTSGMLGARAVIVRKDGTTAFGRESLLSGSAGRKVKAVLSGAMLSGWEGNDRTCYVALPLNGSTDEIEGALFVFADAPRENFPNSTMAQTILFALVIVLPVFFSIGYFLLIRFLRPLGKMRDVALRMAQGRFEDSANEKAPGEVGQLGASINSISRALKKSIEDLTLERNRLISILNGISEGIAAVDRLGRVTHMNPALEVYFLRNPDEADPRMSVIGVPRIWEAFDRAVNEGERAEFVIRERERDIACMIAPVNDKLGRSAGAVGLFRDISREVRLENTRREYVANVSHEMRTPLTAVRGLIEPLRDGMVKDEATRRRYYEIILREVLRLSRLINDIMELSRLQSGMTGIEREDFVPGEQIADICERYGAMAAEKGLRLDTEGDLSALPAVHFNRDRLEQILVILLDNAIKYTDRGGITVSYQLSDREVLLTVSDTGRGISEETQSHVFERFYKADKAHSGKGSGLGLSIAREVLVLMGERINVRSEEGKGSAFAFTMTRAAEEKNERLSV